jgi:hypothetical protein
VAVVKLPKVAAHVAGEASAISLGTRYSGKQIAAKRVQKSSGAKLSVPEW